MRSAIGNNKHRSSLHTSRGFHQTDQLIVY